MDADEFLFQLEEAHVLGIDNLDDDGSRFAQEKEAEEDGDF